MKIAVRQVLVWISSIIFLGSCHNPKTGTIHNRNVEVENSINNFILRDTTYTCKLKIQAKNLVNDFHKGEGVYFTNKTKTEFLFLAAENGGVNYQYDYFYLSDSIPKEYKSKAIVLSDSIFLTSNHLHLGSSLNEFKKIYYGTNLQVTNRGNEKEFVYVDSINQYSCLYKFRRNQLVHIEFGYIW